MIKTEKKLDTSTLLRMPWTNSDNAFSWLEITRRCNLNCDYCYQKNLPQSDKSIIQVENELRTILRLRKCDTILISGGEPLVHPSFWVLEPRPLTPSLVGFQCSLHCKNGLSSSEHANSRRWPPATCFTE